MSLAIRKCLYKNDHQTACCLMIDDLVPAAVSLTGELGPHNDWGYLMDSDGSLFSYLDKWLFSKYPEIRGTVFFPLQSQNFLEEGSGYRVLKRDTDQEYMQFIANRVLPRFELAFHGIKHAFKDFGTGEIALEFAMATDETVRSAIIDANDFMQAHGIKFEGGKFPGYRHNSSALKVISGLKCKWWALTADMIQRIGDNNMFHHPEQGFVQIPTNICGDALSYTADPGFIKNVKRRIKNKYAGRPLEYLAYLYHHRLPITIQEHFQNQRTDGLRQRPNLYDDIASLDVIYSYLRGKDVWHANCTEMAHYFDSYKKTRLCEIDNATFGVSYDGMFDDPLISISADFPRIESLKCHDTQQGIFKKGRWIFNIKKSGDYRMK